MQKKTIFEFDGFGFKFGMHSAALVEKSSGTSITGLLKKMNTEGESVTAILQYFQAAAHAFNAHKGIDKIPTDAEVSDYLETIGEEKASEILSESFGMPKNSEAPKMETGQTSQ